jgi:hypothetical protein
MKGHSMKELLQKIIDQAVKSGIASEMRSRPGASEHSIDLTFVLPEGRPAGGNKDSEQQSNPLDRIAKLLLDVGLQAAAIRYFPAAKSAAIIATNVIAIRNDIATQKPITSNQ